MVIQARPAEIVTIRLEPSPQHRVLRAWQANANEADR